MEKEHVFKGCIPALMTPCNEKGKPDFFALVKKAKYLINLIGFFNDLTNRVFSATTTNYSNFHI